MQQHFGATALYEDHNYFGPGLLDLADTLEKQLEASNLALGEISSAGNTELQESAVEFELEDNGQLLQDMLQQQQPPTSQQQQQQHHNHQQHQQQQHHHHQQQQQQQPSSSSWEENVHVLQEMLMVQQQQQLQAQQQNFFSTAPKFRRESELLSLLQLPRCASSSLPGSITGPFNSVNSKRFTPTSSELGADSHIQGQNLLPQQPSLRHLLHTLPHSADHLDGNAHEEGRLFPNLFEKRDFTFGKAAENRGINHFATERQRREYLNEKYQTLRSLVPNPSKADRASIVADAIDYVKELKRTVQELQLLVQEKKRSSNKKRCKSSPDNPSGEGSADMEGSSVIQPGQGMRVSKEASFIGDGSQLRSSWLQRTSQMGTHIDVRIVDDEVNIKLTQRRRRNCVLLAVLQSLHELRLDLLHANGASIGEHHIFMFNTKIMEGASTFAGQVATKLIDAVDRHITLASSGL